MDDDEDAEIFTLEKSANDNNPQGEEDDDQKASFSLHFFPDPPPSPAMLLTIPEGHRENQQDGQSKRGRETIFEKLSSPAGGEKAFSWSAMLVQYVCFCVWILMASWFPGLLLFMVLRDRIDD